MAVAGLWWIRRLIAEAKRIWAGELPRRRGHTNNSTPSNLARHSKRTRGGRRGGDGGRDGGRDGGWLLSGEARMRGVSEGGTRGQEGR
jgi:hypothetical protein